MNKFSLRLNDNNSNGSEPGARWPVMGLCAVGFGLLGIFGPAFVFVPLALITAIIAIFMGQGSWGFVGLLLAVAGVLSSPILLGMIGFSYFMSLFDFSGMMQTVTDFFSSLMS